MGFSDLSLIIFRLIFSAVMWFCSWGLFQPATNDLRLLLGERIYVIAGLFVMAGGLVLPSVQAESVHEDFKTGIGLLCFIGAVLLLVI